MGEAANAKILNRVTLNSQPLLQSAQRALYFLLYSQHHMIKAIAFDYAGVLEIPERNITTELSDYLNVSIEEWQAVYYKLNHLCNTGTNTWTEVAILTGEKLGATKEQQLQMKEIMRLNVETKKVNDGLVEIIKKLKSKYKIALISNYPAYLREKLQKQNLTELFDEIIISGEVGYQKPQPEIFTLLCDRLHIAPSELIFIDDTTRSLEGADKIGYTPILYVNNNQLEKDLLEILESRH